MRRYGFTFIKSDGVDYKGSILIEGVFFIGLLFFSLLIIFIPSGVEEILLGFFLICLAYGVLSFFAEIIPRTAFFMAIVLSLFLLSVFLINCLHEWSKVSPESVIIYLNGSMSVYFILIGNISYYLFKEQNKLKSKA